MSERQYRLTETQAHNLRVLVQGWDRDPDATAQEKIASAELKRILDVATIEPEPKGCFT